VVRGTHNLPSGFLQILLMGHDTPRRLGSSAYHIADPRSASLCRIRGGRDLKTPKRLMAGKRTIMDAPGRSEIKENGSTSLRPRESPTGSNQSADRNLNSLLSQYSSTAGAMGSLLVRISSGDSK
jgi:hypothetical protein